jgi:hypothetical protein
MNRGAIANLLMDSSDTKKHLGYHESIRALFMEEKSYAKIIVYYFTENDYH